MKLPTLVTLVSLLLASLVHFTLGSNILVVQPIFSGSHEFILRLFAEYMTTRGHTVTVVRFASVKNPKFSNSSVNVINVKPLDDDGSCSNFITPDGKWDVGLTLADQLWNFDGGWSFLSLDMFCRYRVQCETILDKQLFHSLKVMSFDVAIVDILSNGCGVALAKALNLPVASFWVFGFTGFDAASTPTLSIPSTVPAAFTGLPEKMSFWQRIENLVKYNLYLVYHEICNTINQRIVSEMFPNLPPVWEMTHDIDIHLIVPNFLTTKPKLTAPNVFSIGGPHLAEGQSLTEVRPV